MYMRKYGLKKVFPVKSLTEYKKMAPKAQVSCLNQHPAGTVVHMGVFDSEL